MQFRLTTLLTILIFNLSTAQEIIQTDRPSASTAAYILPVGRLQVETGSLFGIGVDNGNFDYFNNNFNTTLVRFGLSSSAELRLEQGYVQTIARIGDFEEKLSGLTNFGLGGKFAIFKQKGWIPPVTLIANVRAPYTSSEIGSRYLYGDYLLATDINIVGKLGLIANYGGSWNGNNANYNNFYALTLAYSVNERFCAFIEPYGNWDNAVNFNQSFNAGITYAAAKKFQVDLIAGYDRSWANFFNIGGGLAFYIF
jgi:hypothetical protein